MAHGEVKIEIYIWWLESYLVHGLYIMRFPYVRETPALSPLGPEQHVPSIGSRSVL